MKRTSVSWFLLASLLLCLFVFRDGLWGGSLLAPLDILSNLSPKYRYLDPQATGVPANQHIIDQVEYDLPLQRTIYESYRRGDIPWWDPYILGGRPFLADAHISAVDPVRVLLYRMLRFELAYNWTLVTHFLIGGLMMFLLLRHYGFGQWVCVGLAIAYEFAGCNSLFFCHPWIHASFAYYPLLWWLWDKALEKPDRWRTAVASLPVAAIFLAGNLQSHAYVALFAGVFCLGYGWTDPRRWRKSLQVVAPSVVIGACLAAPFLSAEVELFRNNLRAMPHPPRIAWLSGLASLSTVYPWMLGTFRTLDLGRFVHQNGAGFLIYIGSVGAVLALVGGIRPAPPGRRTLKRQALALVILYGIILSCPLQDFLYARSSGLPVLGLTLLAAMGTEELFTTASVLRRFGWSVITLAIVLMVAMNVAAFVIYPRVLPKVREFVAAHNAKTGFGEEARALREFQVVNLPREISVRNPETVAAFAGLLGVGCVMLFAGIRKNPLIQPALLALNLVPLLLFTARFIPRQPMELWNRLLAGGPAQREVVDVLGDTQLRLWEITPGEHQKLFPYDMAHLYRVRTIHGYSALHPRCLYELPPEEQKQYRPELGDYIYENRESGLGRGEFIKNPTPGLVRFHWETTNPRGLHAEQYGLNEIHVHFDAGPAGTLVWTDTRYPGWQATLDGFPLTLRAMPPTFTALEITNDARELVLRYRPTYLRPSLAASIGAMLLVGGTLVARIGMRRQTPGAPDRG
ncbi:MAG: hypothetical protein ABSA12_01655 [Verrucomicrobiia bacterium]